MAAHDRTRLNGQLHFFWHDNPGFQGNFPFPGDFGALSPGRDTSIACNCLIFKHNYLMRYFQYAQYPIVFIDLLPQEKTVKTGVNKLL
jgi:hypothetical protein